MPEKKASPSLIARVRILYRDVILRITELGESFDASIASKLVWDTGYQYKWTRLDVHRTMLADEVRVKAFEKAIGEVVRSGDSVLDVGTGTGILAFFAEKAGAGRVYAVDSASVINFAKKAAEINGFKKTEFIRADIRDLKVPSVDCIIAELLGPNVIEEGFIEKITKVGRFLKSGGKIMPSRIDVYVAPVECKDMGVGFWDKLYGIDYTSIDRDVRELRSFEATEKTQRLSPDVLAFSIDSLKPPKKQLKFEREFTIERDGEFHGLLMYFVAQLSPKTSLSTSPESPPTHWKQTLIPSGIRTKLKKGDKINVKLWASDGNKIWKWKYEINGF